MIKKHEEKRKQPRAQTSLFGLFSVVIAFHPPPSSVLRRLQTYIFNKTLISIEKDEEIRKKILTWPKRHV